MSNQVKRKDEKKMFLGCLSHFYAITVFGCL